MNTPINIAKDLDTNTFARATAGKLITFSGTDGSGKTTLASILVDTIQHKGGHPLRVWSRGGHTPFLEFLRTTAKKLFRKPKVKTGQTKKASGGDDFSTKNKWVNYGYIHVSLLELIWLYGVYIRFQRWRGKVIICDRYVLDTLVDFTARFGYKDIDKWFIWRLVELIAPHPQIAFLILTPVEVSIQRLDDSNDPLDARPIRLEERLAHYQKLAQSGDWYVLDSLRTLDELAQEITTHVEHRFQG